jgi:hypothetical protein
MSFNPGITLLNVYHAMLLAYQQVIPVGASLTLQTGYTALLTQDWQNNGDVVMQGTSSLVWVH